MGSTEKMFRQLTPLLLSLSSVLGFRSFYRQRELLPLARDVVGAEDQYFEQVLDHFNAIDGRTWQQRYWVNLEHYVKKGPAFIMIGGEAEANPSWMKWGQWYKWAEENGAAMFLLEHRYYGQSHPTEDMSTDNMRYLSSRQGLDDLGHFMTAMNNKYNLTGSWITFGGSYPGSLSAWMSLKFPHLVAGSVSSSGPLYAKLDYFEYLEVVEDAFGTTGPGCNDAITKAIAAVEDHVEDEEKWEDVSTMFRLCETLDGNKTMDVKSFIGLLIDNLAGVVQYNGQYEEDIFSICKTMTDENIGEPINRLATVNGRLLGSNKEKCLNHTYESFLDLITETSWIGGGIGWRQWIWQTCTEFGWYQTTNQDSGVYGSSLSLDFFEQWCQDAFGEEFNLEMMEKSITASNIEYGGFEPIVNNVVFVHGSIDPWNAMGVLEDLHEGAPSIYITGTSHCVDMYEDMPSDPEELVAARVTIGKLVKEWVQNARE